MSEEEKKDIKVKETEERSLEPWYPSEVFRAFDDMWEDFRRGFLRPWRFWGRPWRMRRGEALAAREVCTDLIDAGKEFKVCAEVPGIPKENLDIKVTKDGIEISGKAGVQREEEEKGYLVKERGYSEVYRKMSFPEEVIPEKAEANFKDGLLEVKIPKKTPTPKAKKHKVNIK
jgi:HSP20 family protein